jgi:hypothetical protein
MPSRYGDSLTDWADIVTSTVTNGEVRLNLGDATKGTGVDSGSPFFGVDGFASRPNESGQDGAAQCFYVISGNQKIGIGVRDCRYLTRLSALKPGDRLIYSAGKAMFLLKNADDLVGVYTERQSDGMSILQTLSGKTGEALTAVGLTKVQVEETRIELSINGGAAIIIEGNTITMRANLINIDAGFCTLGVNSDGTRPIVPGLQSVCAGPSGQVAIGVPKVLVATY